MNTTQEAAATTQHQPAPGPWLRIEPNGDLKTKGHTLTKLPTETWLPRMRDSFAEWQAKARDAHSVVADPN